MLKNSVKQTAMKDLTAQNICWKHSLLV